MASYAEASKAFVDRSEATRFSATLLLLLRLFQGGRSNENDDYNGRCRFLIALLVEFPAPQSQPVGASQHATVHRGGLSGSLIIIRGRCTPLRLG